MNRFISKYLLYNPVTIFHGEFVSWHKARYGKMQNWDRPAIQSYHEKMIRNLFEKAVKGNSYYKALYRDVKFSGLADLKLLPTISKTDLADIQKGIQGKSIFRDFFTVKKTTGGSTGVPVTIHKNSSALGRERAATWVAYEWAGVNVASPQARLWGDPITTKGRIKRKLIDWLANRIRLSAFDLTDESMSAFYQRMWNFKPVYLYGYTSALLQFSEYLASNNLSLPPSVVSVISTSEVLSDHIRSTLERNLSLQVFNEYGCGEVGSIAHECEFGNLHLMEQNLVVEIDTMDGQDYGEIIVTDLFNNAMPIIRYRTGDYGRMSDAQCPCGRGLKVLDHVFGRAYDAITGPDGKKIHPELIMYLFEDLKRNGFVNIQQFQVVQEEVNRFLIRLVFVGESVEKKRYENALIELFRKNVNGSVSLVFEYVAAISREKSGKMRLVKSCIG